MPKKTEMTLGVAEEGAYAENAHPEPRSVEDTVIAEGRTVPDQIPDYHDRFPTLDTSGPEYDPEVQQKLRDDYYSLVTADEQKVLTEQAQAIKEQEETVVPPEESVG